MPNAQTLNAWSEGASPDAVKVVEMWLRSIAVAGDPGRYGCRAMQVPPVLGQRPSSIRWPRRQERGQGPGD